MCIRKELWEQTHGANLRKHAIKRNRWSETTFDSVDWDTCEIALKKQRQETKTRVIKFAHNWLPVGKQQERMCKGKPSKCPTCQEEETVETTDHSIDAQSGKHFEKKD